MKMLIFNLFSKLCLNCRDAAKLVSESCERKLTFFERVKLGMLRKMCPYTSRYVDQVNLLHQKIPDLDKVFEKEHSDACLSDETREKIKRELEASQDC